MKTELKNSLKLNRTLIILSFVCILLSIAACVLGELVTPFIIGVLSVIYLFDAKSKHAFSTIVSLILIGLNATAILLKISVSMFAPTAIILSFILVISFIKGQSKSDCSYVMTLIASAFSLIGYILFAMIEVGNFSLDAAVDFYSSLADALRTVFVEGMMEVYTAAGFEITEEIVTVLFNQQLNMIISYLIIGGFVIVGVGMKLFGWIVGYLSENNTHIKEWRFMPTKIYAYAYVILVVLSLFATASDSVFSISVSNLYNIFSIIFAYVGFGVVLGMLKKRMKPVFAVLAMLGILIVFASFVLQILAAIGVLFTVRINNLNSDSTNTDINS